MISSVNSLRNLDLLANETLFRFSCFIGILLLMFVLETYWPRRTQLIRLYRWKQNLLLALIDGVTVRVLLPGATIATAMFAAEHKVGLWHWMGLPESTTVVVSVVLLDMLIYWQHRIFHKFNPLWRLHRVHHSDIELDASSGSRFHPLEILFSLLLKLVVIILLGIPAVAILIFEILLNVTAVFNHSNIRLPNWLEKLLRPVLVTPDMHRIHHSVYYDEHNSNFGFASSVWDRLFCSYCATPKDGHADMTIGLADYREIKDQRVDKLISQPFTRR